MLTFTRKTDYALIAMTHLAQRSVANQSAREIATLYKLPLPLLMNVLKQLAQHDLIHSIRGPRGGYTLAKPPNEISLHDIIRAVEGPVHLVHCVPRRNENGEMEGGEAGCELTGHCPVRASIHRVHYRFVRFLEDFKLAEIADRAAARIEAMTCNTPSVEASASAE